VDRADHVSDMIVLKLLVDRTGGLHMKARGRAGG